MRYPSNSYPLSYYDDQMCLKPPLLLWAAVFYLSRAITLPIAMAIANFAGVDSRAITVVRAFWSLDALLPSLIAVVILYALCRRVPTASKPVRWIWARGQIILSIAAALDIALLLIGMIRRGEFNDHALPLSVFAVLVDVYFLVYILMARRVRQTFAEFPPPLLPHDPVNPAAR
ncbi:MAG TPA: DUF2919 family protein [Steroidobacteraceae bacterium]|jgi:hypothetical protein|nr:DUF2919 family protein [Steroidobacteraceae bacterium]